LSNVPPSDSPIKTGNGNILSYLTARSLDVIPESISAVVVADEIIPTGNELIAPLGKNENIELSAIVDENIPTALLAETNEISSTIPTTPEIIPQSVSESISSVIPAISTENLPVNVLEDVLPSPVENVPQIRPENILEEISSIPKVVEEEESVSNENDVEEDSSEDDDLENVLEYGRYQREILPHLPGVYVLQLENNCIYVGKSNQNVDARVKEHFTSGGSAFTKKFKPISQLMPLTQPTSDLESYERAETLEQMWVNGIKNVRGWQYTKLYMTEFEYESVFRQMCERKDLCR
jgi:predicted GIY-YIG superfamily endonuclease